MARDKAGSPKWCATALQGYFRQGLAEIRAAMPHAESPIAQPTNYAMPGMATPGEVTEARRDESPSLDEESKLDRYIQPPEIGPDDPNRDDRGMERE